MCVAGFGTYRRPLGESRLFIARRLERITTDICRYRSSAGRRHHRLVWVIRRFGDISLLWIASELATMWELCGWAAPAPPSVSLRAYQSTEPTRYSTPPRIFVATSPNQKLPSTRRRT